MAPGGAKVAGLYVICSIEKDRALERGLRRRADARLEGAAWPNRPAPTSSWRWAASW